MVVALSTFDTINEVFQALFFSQYGSIIGLLLFVILCVAIFTYKYELTFITFLATVFLALEYFNHWGTVGLFVWNIVLLFAFATIQVVFFVQKTRERG